MEQPCVSDAACSSNGDICGSGVWTELCKQLVEDCELDWLLGLTVFLPVVALDAMNEPLHERRLADGEREVCVDVHQTDVGKVLLDGPRLDATGEGCNPGHDCMLGSWEERTVGVVKVVELDKIDKGALAGGVCCARAGGNAVP